MNNPRDQSLCKGAGELHRPPKKGEVAVYVISLHNMLCNGKKFKKNIYRGDTNPMKNEKTRTMNGRATIYSFIQVNIRLTFLTLMNRTI